MKYFKCTNQLDSEDVFYTSSSTDKASAEDIARILNLDQYTVEECTEAEFNYATAEDFEEEEDDDPKTQALNLVEESRALLMHIEGLGESGVFIDEPVLDYLDLLTEKLQELELKLMEI